MFTDRDATGISVKLPKEEAAAVVATVSGAEPTSYGLGRHGWVSIDLGAAPDWVQVTEWVRTSYTMVAPPALARRVPGGGRDRRDRRVMSQERVRVPQMRMSALVVFPGWMSRKLPVAARRRAALLNLGVRRHHHRDDFTMDRF